jgi:hypothetical protein
MIQNSEDLTKFNERLALTANPYAKAMWVVGYGRDVPPSAGLTWTTQQPKAQLDTDYSVACLDGARNSRQAEYGVLFHQREAVLNTRRFFSVLSDLYPSKGARDQAMGIYQPQARQRSKRPTTDYLESFATTSTQRNRCAGGVTCWHDGYALRPAAPAEPR